MSTNALCRDLPDEACCEQAVPVQPGCSRHRTENALQLLLVEDNYFDTMLFKKMLHDSSRGQEFEITDVPRLSDALKVTEKIGYDAIILDLSLPDTRGLDAVITLQVIVPEIPLVVYSGSHDSTLLDEARLWGAAAVLTKGHDSGFQLSYAIKQAILQGGRA